MFPLHGAFAQIRCELLLTDQARTVGARFHHFRNRNFHTNPHIEKTSSRHARQTGQQLSKPVHKIEVWLRNLDAVNARAEKSRFVRSQITEILRRQFVMDRKDIPESYFNLQIKLARERGHGQMYLTEMLRRKMSDIVISDQTASLDSWIDYLISPDTNMYPIWLKIWIFNGMTKLSKYDAETASFGKRDKKTVAPFPELNREALAYVVDKIAGESNGKKLEDLSDSELFKIVENADFGKLYAREIQKCAMNHTSENSTVDGAWVLYPRGSDYMPLVKAIDGRNTGWCTAGRETAKKQLQAGDFYIYFSKDEASQNKIPRIAIRMEGDDIAEVRGIAKDQNLDPQIAGSDILSLKMKEFGSKADEFNQKDRDMKRLTDIDERIERGEQLSKLDLRFLYEIDSPIKGFGYSKDTRISAILEKRDPRKDISFIMDVEQSKISMNSKDALLDGIVLHYGNLHLVWTNPDQKLPEIVIGDFSILDGYLPNITMPRRVTGSVSFGSKIKTLEGVTLPESIDGDLELGHLTSISDLRWPKQLGGKLTLSSNFAGTYRNYVPAEIKKMDWAGDIWRIRHR